MKRNQIVKEQQMQSRGNFWTIKPGVLGRMEYKLHHLTALTLSKRFSDLMLYNKLPQKLMAETATFILPCIGNLGMA